MGPGANRETASAAVEAVLSSILSAAKTEKVHVARFGTFEIQSRPAHRGFDINRSAPCTFPASARLCFRPAQGFLPHPLPPFPPAP